MKTKPILHTSAGILFLILSLGAAPAQNAPHPRPSVAAKAAAASPVDPVTGLPVAQPQPEPEWIGPDWVGGSDMILTNVVYDSEPISEVVEDLRARFKGTFDIVLSPGWRTPDESGTETIDPGSLPIKMQLKNVNAGEVFRAMNSLFEIQNAPLRWQLKLNGKRSMLLLRVIPELLPHAAAPVDPTTGLPLPAAAPAESKKPMVFFVGDMVGDEKSGGMTMSQIADTLTEINKMAYGGDIFIGFHTKAQLVIVKGTDEQIGFVRNTLSELRARTDSALVKTLSDRNKKSDELKSSGGGGSK